MESYFSGITGKSVSKIGLGCVTFGREIDKKASFAMMDRALECGITFFDTASAYGNGASETIIGQWLCKHQSISSSILIGTKLLPPYNRQNISQSISRSLKNLKVDSIDLLYLHRWDHSLMDREALKVLGDFVYKGRIKCLGASNFTAVQLTESLTAQKELDLPLFRFLENNNNFAVRDITEEIKTICSENGIFIVTYSPLGAGFLTGKHQDGIKSGTRFEIIPGHKDVYFNNTAFRRLSFLKSISERSGYSTVHLALAWALHQEGVSSVLAGGRTPEHIDQALAAMSFNFPEILNELESG